MRRKICLCVAALLALAPLQAHSSTITIVSNSGTLAQQIGSGGAATPADIATLNGANYNTASAVPVVVGAYGTFTPVPSGAPSGTEVVTIPPVNPGPEYYNNSGNNGYFLSSFILPVGFTNASLSGAANVDDYGSVFLNGALITSLGAITEFGNAAFSAANGFVAGENWLVISDINTGGPSGTAFYATVTYNNATAVPEPGTMMLLGVGLAGLGLVRRRAKK